MNENYLKENSSLIHTVKDVLSNHAEMNPLLLYKMFINEIYVFSNEVKFDVFMFD